MQEPGSGFLDLGRQGSVDAGRPMNNNSANLAKASTSSWQFQWSRLLATSIRSVAQKACPLTRVPARSTGGAAKQRLHHQRLEECIRMHRTNIMRAKLRPNTSSMINKRWTIAVSVQTVESVGKSVPTHFIHPTCCGESKLCG